MIDNVCMCVYVCINTTQLALQFKTKMDDINHVLAVYDVLALRISLMLLKLILCAFIRKSRSFMIIMYVCVSTPPSSSIQNENG